MLVVIAGAGNLGQYLLEFFSKQNVDLVLIEKDEQKINRIKNRYDILSLKGDSLSHYVLRSANVGACDLFIACTFGDSTNIVSCQLAKRLGSKHSVARIYSEDIFPYQGNDLEQYFGVDWLVSPSMLTGYRLANFLFDDADFVYDNYFGARMNVSKIILNKDCECLGSTPAKILKPYNGNLRLVNFIRDNRRVPPQEFNKTLFQENDQVVLIGKGHITSKFLDDFHPTDFFQKKIYIAGISTTTYTTLSLWQEKSIKANVTVFENNLQVCEDLMEKFNVKIINLDSADFSEIQKFDPDLTGVFICSGVNDADNLTFALNAQQMGFKHIITMVNEYDKMRLFKHFSAFKTISPPELSAQEIHRYFNQEISIDFELIKGSHVRSIIKTIGQDSKWLNRDVADLAKELKHLEILCIWDQGKVELYHPETRMILKENSKLLIACLDGEHKNLEKLLSH